MTVEEFITNLPADRQELFTALHEVIINNDSSIIPVVKSMMGKEMILYEERCYMKYGLASVKNYLSLHCMPIYMNPALHSKYAALLPNAKVQKGCVNFTGTGEMPLEIAVALIADCSQVNIAEVLENRKKKK